MEFGDKWLGKVAGGFSIALIGGYSYYQANLWNMNGGEIPIKVIVKGTQLGLVANAEVSHAIIFLTGAPHPDAFDKIESRGIDWSFNFVGGIDNMAKSLGYLARALRNIPGNN